MANCMAPAMPVIAFNYGRIRQFGFNCTDRMSVQHCKSRPGHSIGGAKINSLLKLNVTRPGVNVQQHAAIAHFALNMVLGQGALCCYLMAIELQRS